MRAFFERHGLLAPMPKPAEDPSPPDLNYLGTGPVTEVQHFIAKFRRK